MRDKEDLDLNPIFNPQSVAVIGASRNPLKWGFIVLGNIVLGKYKGKIYPVNPNIDNVLGLKAYPNLKSIEDEIDLAVIITPADTVREIMKECVKRRVKSAVVISAGFSETGEEGAKLEEEVVKIARQGGVHLVGPNTMGVFGADPNLCALMPPVKPLRGSVSFVAQSGNLGTQLLGLGEAQGVGFSKFACSGNEGDLHCEDYIKFFGDDPQTKVILAYIEGLDEGRKFLEIAKEVSKRKPIVILKAGRTQAGSRAAVSHTGALSGSKEIYDAAFKQAGIIRASTAEEMLDFSRGFASLPLPKGRRVGILTWGGGWGVVTADACEEGGLKVATLPEEVIKELNKLLPPYWSKGNPIDLVGSLDRPSHLRCLEVLGKCEEIEGIIALGILGASPIFTSMLSSSPDLSPIKEVKFFEKEFEKVDQEFEVKIVELMKEYKKPIIGVNMFSDQEAKEKGNIPIYPSPERAVKVMVKLFEYHNYLENT
ncbi:MAG: hypothetical protein COS84_07465 [Armatimonadetes bacterium CG07_land_8_20_14_0_80_40_9]|nr:MAG: hypothetical protein COS84_07465 [Armatimonadetes bacterium CG07_land_8_20_14_0_80_40_9]